VDKLGWLSDALDLASKKASLGRDYDVRLLPKPSGFAEFLSFLQKLMGKEGEDEFEIGMGPSLRNDPLLRAALPLVRDLAPAQLRQLVRDLCNLVILQRERVGCFMPLVPQVR
jgi:hypothetical protein